MIGKPATPDVSVPRLLLALLDELRHQPPRLLRGGVLSRRGLERLVASLGLTPDRNWAEAPAFAYAHWLLALARQLGLLGGVSRLEPVPAVAGPFFAGTPADRTRLLLLAWQKVDQVQGPPEQAAPSSPELPQRTEFGGLTTGLFGEEELADPWAALLADHSPRSLGAEAPSTAAYVLAEEEAAAPLGPSAPMPLPTLKRRLVRALAKVHRQGPLSLVAFLEEFQTTSERSAPPPEEWLREQLQELVDLGVLERSSWQEQGEVRVLADGAFALGAGGRPPRPLPPRPRLLVQPTFSVVVVCDEEELAIPYELGRFSRPEGPPPSFSYRINVRSVVRAGREGLPLSAVHRLLSEGSPHPLPQNVQHTLEAWEHSQQQLTLRRGVTLAQFSDPALFDEKLAFAELTPGVRAVSQELMLLPVRNRDEVVQVLGTNDFIDLDYAAPLPPCLEVTGPELTLRPLPSATNLWTPLLLQRHASAPDAQGLCRIELGRLRELAAAQGEPGIEPVRRSLAAALVGGLPAELELLLRAATGGSTGEVCLVSAPVLICETPEELEAVLRLPAVRVALVRRLGPAAVLLRQGTGAELLGLLRTLGLTVVGELPEDAPGLPEETVTGPGPVLQALRDAVLRGEELTLTYDRGARRPLEELRVVARDLVSRNGRHYLRALRPGQTETHEYAVNYVSAVRRRG